MRIAEINSPSSRLTESDESAAGPDVFKDSAGRALLVIEPSKPTPPVSAFRQAPFLAQLIATKDKHPQTRTRRRVEPAVAIDAYRAVEAMMEFEPE